MARFPGRLQDGLTLDSLRRAVGAKHASELRTSLHSLIHVEDHLAQMCLDGSRKDEPYFGQWIFFDGLWASAHSDLANAILRFAARWDVLSADGGGEPRE